MADEPDNETETPKTPAEQAPEAAAVEQTPAPAGEETPAAQAQTPEPAVEAAIEEAPPEVRAATGPSEPVEQISSKERRRRARSTHSGEARTPRTAQERQAERVAERRDKAVRRRARRLQERAKATERRVSAPAPEPLPPVHAPVEGARKVRQGIVVSDKADKTITVRIDTARRHRRYEKIVRSSSTLHAHDENNEAHAGDVVRVVESRPLSRSKRWRLVDVLERAR
jgi:small subunit ribosomal protein S17